ncbi:MAG TPA: DUF4352 domain-containing protein [Candidatus Acidoferrum sp.]|nr:DUF4352 domain-containing protein [Candidatus Acidoferrum sp.]
MSAFTPQFAPIVVLLFLGAILLLGMSLLVLFYGAARQSALFAKVGGGAVIAIAGAYFLLLGGVSFASSEETLPPGGWKYFCEIDCHLAYSIVGVQTAAALGPELQQTTARGKFVIVRVKTWFDERTISAHRGNVPLTPNARRVLLVDDRGRSYDPSAEGQFALARGGNNSKPLTQALRPGESYTTDLVFDVPKDARGLRLLITEDDPETRFVIGHENSLLHKKIYFDLGAGSLRAASD